MTLGNRTDPQPSPPVTVPADDVRNVFPFVPPRKIGTDFPGDFSGLPLLYSASFVPNDPDNSFGSGSIKIVVTKRDGQDFLLSDFGYIVLAEGVVDGVEGFVACEATLSPGSNESKGFLIVVLPKKPTRIKVTILTRKAIDIINLV